MDQTPQYQGWNIVKLLGRGSSGAVYEIERDIFGRMEKAALKVITIPGKESDIDELRSEGYDDVSITKRFREYLHDIIMEYSLMAEMKGCTNIVYCDDVKYIQQDNAIGWNVLIKMELLTPLVKAPTSSGPESMAIRVGTGIANALAFCESKDILHRDIKPHNIFVSPDGTCKLGDFGIAKIMNQTSSGTVAGTYKYMAPEVYHKQPYGAKADIYSLGLVLYWILNNKRMPFLPPPSVMPTVGEEEAALQRRFDGEALPPPAHGSEALKQIVLKACAYDPQDRWQSAEELLQALRNCETEGSEETQRVFGYAAKAGAQQGTVKLFRGDRRALEGERTAATVQGQTKDTVYEKRAQSQEEAPEKGKGKKAFLWIGLGLAMLAVIALAVGLLWHRLGAGKTDDGETDGGERKKASHMVNVSTKDSEATPEPTSEQTPELAIITQPKSVTVTEGESASFEVAASGSGLNYQWWYQKPGDTSWTAVKSNGTSAVYTLTTQERHNGYIYRCEVKNAAGSVESAEATLTVIAVAEPDPTPVPGPVVCAKEWKGDYSDGTGNSYHYCYRIPALTSSGEDAQRMNERVYKFVMDHIEKDLKNIEENTGHALNVRSADYGYSVCGNTVSIISLVTDAAGTTQYQVLNLDTAIDREVGRAYMLEKFGLDESSFTRIARGVAANEFEVMNQYSDAQKDFAEQQLQKTISEDNLANTYPFINGSGRLCMVVRIYSVKGSDYYWRSLVVY